MDLFENNQHALLVSLKQSTLIKKHWSNTKLYTKILSSINVKNVCGWEGGSKRMQLSNTFCSKQASQKNKRNKTIKQSTFWFSAINLQIWQDLVTESETGNWQSKAVKNCLETKIWIFVFNNFSRFWMNMKNATKCLKK